MAQEVGLVETILSLSRGRVPSALFSLSRVLSDYARRSLTLICGYTALLAVCCLPSLHAWQQPEGMLVVQVRNGAAPVEQAEIRVGDRTAITGATGETVLSLPAGPAELSVTRFGFESRTVRVAVQPLTRTTITIELEPESVLSEEVVVTATRTERRIEDVPMRVEVVPQEEVEEKVFMTPGDVSMMLTETNGLRVQVTSPSLGAANVRVQGMRGRYTQILADGLPLYGQTGSIGILQIPPMDLRQVEVIKGVASALYGASALGGVVNLVSRRPQPGRTEREVLVNRTSRGGTDTVLWLSGGRGRWGYSLLGGGHWQERQDVDNDGWTDLPGYKRAVARPRMFWENGKGRSVFMTAGAVAEDRTGGTMPEKTAPDGRAFPENLGTRRFDGGLIGRVTTSGGRLFTIRASAMGQGHRHHFGEVRERDTHATGFIEGSLTGSDRRHSWVVGAAVQRDAYRAKDVRGFDYAYTVPGVFGQDDYTPAAWFTVSASVRVDAARRFGTFFSPRVSTLIKPGGGWTVRVSTGTGFFLPTPFTEETEATGLSRLSPLGDLDPERGRSLSVDFGWRRSSLEITTTLFRSRVDDALVLRTPATADMGHETPSIINAGGPTRTIGSELIARFHRGEMDLIATHMYVWGTESDPDTGMRRQVPLNPRHTAGIDWLWDIEGRGRVGLEIFYTGRQQLDDSAYRRNGKSYVLWGAVGDWRVGRARLFANVENLSNVRQTKHDPLVRPTRAGDGRWTTDVWAPLDGRVFNAGVRFRF